MLNRLTDALDFQAQALNLRAERQRLLASNIANADTPGYVAREMNFAQALRNATGGGSAGGTGTASGVAGATGVAATPAGTMAATDPGHLGGNGAASGLTVSTLDYAMPAQNSLDRNTVDMDRERASFADNTVKYEATLRFLGAQVKTELSAITGQ